MNGRTAVVYIQPNSEIGGSDICLLRLIQALDKDRFAPIVIVPRDGPLVSAFEREGAKVRFVPMAHLRTKLSPTYQLGYLGKYWPTVLALRRTILETKADIVHTNSLYSLYGAWAARLAKRPHVWHVREIPPAIPIAKAVLAAFVRETSAKVINMTSACERSLFGSHVPANSSVLYEGINLQEFRSDISGSAIRAQLGVDAAAPLVGFVGRLDPWKGLEVFIRSAAIVHARFPEAHFLVAGDAPSGYEHHARSMQSLAASFGLADHMHFCGFQHGFLKIPELMASLTMLCHTSVRPEPFGLVLIEAMAMSRPVIATRMGGPLEIIEHGVSGILIPPGQPQTLGESVCALLSCPERMRDIGKAARRRVEDRFPVSDFSSRLSALYEDVLLSERVQRVQVRSAGGVGL